MFASFLNILKSDFFFQSPITQQIKETESMHQNQCKSSLDQMKKMFFETYFLPTSNCAQTFLEDTRYLFHSYSFVLFCFLS